ncbi:MAG: tRNA (N6-threonylcarbamoyladenosine(37)-N6)-methyltransferase TrmO [Nitrospiria bacterium]
MEFTFTPIGLFHTPYKITESIPKTFGVAPVAEGIVEVFPGFAEGLLHIEEFSHLLIIFVFHKSTQMPLKVVPPTQEKERGVFSSRSPHRPNPVGVLTVRLLKRDGNTLYVEGVDLLDGTPVLDIKPYLLHFDCRPDAKAGL